MQKINEKVEYGWLQISDLHIFDNTEWKVMLITIWSIKNM